MKPLSRLLSARRRPAARHNIRLRCQRLEDRTVPSSFQGLGYLPGYSDSSGVTGISTDGSVAVGDSVGGSERAFRWTAASGMVDLGLLPGGLYAEATGVSGDGSIVVGSCVTADVHGHAFRWTAATGMVDIGALPGVTGAGARGISADGSTIVGVSGHAFRWTQATGMIDLGVLPGGSVSDATAVSADGSVVTGNSSDSHYLAFRWTQATGMVSLGTASGTIDSEGLAISPNGSVVVGECSPEGGPGGGPYYASRWTAATGMATIGLLPGATDSVAFAVTSDGSVVFGESYNSNSGSIRAFHWTTSSGMRDLQNDLVNDYGLGAQLTGWSLSNANCCSPDGRVIAGGGVYPAGNPNNEAWIAHLDAPPQVAATQVNDGSVQRSRLTSLTVRFDSQVTFTGPVADAFSLTRTGGSSVNFAASASVVGGVTVVTLNGFTGADTQFGSLADGRYTLTALASQISANGQQMTSNYTFGDAQGLFRMFGDVNGDQTVNGFDLGFFRNAFGTQAGDPNYLSYLDINGDGAINGFDLGQFRTRFGTMLP